MCGIGGFSLAGGQAPEQALLDGLARALSHRGPDGEGRFQDKGTALIHRRLSIIDVEGGAQPLSDSEDRVQLVCNGEIYNFKPHQKALEESGVHLKTRSDSEVALHLYIRHGLEFVEQLEGMYALALYDARSGDLLLARDPVGIKPLYIAETPRGIAFASEAGALAACGWLTPEVAGEALPELFNRQFTAGRRTLFKGIERLLPGELLVIREGRIVERRRKTLALEAPQDLTEAQALEKLDALLMETTRTHLQSDVPYGAFLSGGIDSSSVLSCMARLDERVTSYTIGFSDRSVADERDLAQRLAGELKLDHHAESFSETDFWELLPVLGRLMDDLVADYAVLPTIKLARRASRDVKVILSGEGGDEVFAGYSRYRRGGLLDSLLGRRFRGRGEATPFAGLFRKELYDWKGGFQVEPLTQPGWTRLQGYQATDIADWLPDDLLTKVDRCLMAFGVEGRVPFLDQPMIEFGFALPDALKLEGKQGKKLLKSWLHARHPQMEVWAKKRGFTVPIAAWLERRRPLLKDYLTSHEGLLEVMERQPLTQLLEKPLEGKGAKLIFTALSYALWHDSHVARRSLEGQRLFAGEAAHAA